MVKWTCLPKFIALRFIRSSHEADWPLHIPKINLMLPYFAAAGHLHYLRYTAVYLIKMAKLTSELFHKFLTGQHAMRHCIGLWNLIYSDMMIETTVMRYDHGPAYMIELTLNESTLEHWAKSLHVLSVLE